MELATGAGRVESRICCAAGAAASIGEIVAHSSSRTRDASSTSSTAGPSWRSDRPRSMAGRSPGSDTANPPAASSTSVSVSRWKLASEATRWRASLRNRKPDWRSDGETTTARPPCNTVQAALSAATVLLPLCRVALSSNRGAADRSTSRCQGSSVSSAMRSAQSMGSSSAVDWAGVRAASELRSRASSRLRAAVLMPTSLARAPSHRQRRRTGRRCGASRSVCRPRPGRYRWHV